MVKCRGGMVKGGGMSHPCPSLTCILRRVSWCVLFRFTPKLELCVNWTILNALHATYNLSPPNYNQSKKNQKPYLWSPKICEFRRIWMVVCFYISIYNELKIGSGQSKYYYTYVQWCQNIFYLTDYHWGGLWSFLLPTAPYLEPTDQVPII